MQFSIGAKEKISLKSHFQKFSAAVGWEENGKTTIIFQRSVNTDDRNTDNGFESEITFIWAFGQSGQEFYKDDQLKFHGKPGTTGVGLGKKGKNT